MPRIAKGLTDLEIKNAKAREKEYIKSDGEGLQIRIRPNGSKSWQFVYLHPISRKKCKIVLGSHPSLKLKEARKIRDSYNEQLAIGIDPKAKKEEQRKEYLANNEYTLTKVAFQWLESKKYKLTPDHAHDIWRSLELHIFPYLANVPVKDINAVDAIKALRPLEAQNKLEMVKRISQRLNDIMMYAIHHGYISSNPLFEMYKVFREPSGDSYPALEPEKLPEFLNRLANASIHISTRCLIEFQLHTLTRPGEASNAEWKEFDFEEKVWIIPAHKMKYYRRDKPKTHRDHYIPLSDQVIALLEIMKPASSNSLYVFPSRIKPNKPVNSSTANMAIKRMGYGGKLVSHGLRSIGSTILHDQEFEHAAVEATLSHVTGNDVERVYRRNKNHLKKRIPIMQWWSDYIDEAAKGSLSFTKSVPVKVLKNI